MSCSKALDFAAPAGAHLSFYWTMAEPGDAAKVDSAQAHAWAAQVGTSSQAGLFDNAVQLDCNGGSIDPHAHGLYNVDDAALAVSSTSKGISFWYWFKLTSAGVIVTTTHFNFEFYTADFSTDYLIRVYASLIPGIGTSGWTLDHLDLNGPGLSESTGNFDLTTDTWHMFAASVDFTNHQLKAYLDGVLKDTQADMVPISASTPLAWLFVDNLFSGAGIGDPFTSLFDEMGLCLNGVLTQAQITSLYNGGTGVTWPAVAAIVPYP